MVTLLSMVICLTHLSMDLVLLDTQEEQPLMLLDQAQELASVVLMLSPMDSMDLFVMVCLLILSEELTRSMLVADTLSNMCPWAREVPNFLSRSMAHGSCRCSIYSLRNSPAQSWCRTLLPTHFLSLFTCEEIKINKNLSHFS